MYKAYFLLLVLYVVIGCEGGVIEPADQAPDAGVVVATTDDNENLNDPVNTAPPPTNGSGVVSSDSFHRVENLTCRAPARPEVAKVGLESVLERSAKRVDMRLLPGQNRFLVAENHGVIKSFSIQENNAGNELLVEESVLLDITDQVEVEFDGVRWAEMGLLGLAIDPGFSNNGYFYIYYSGLGTVDGSKYEGRLSRFRSEDGGVTADPATEEVLIRIDHSVKGEHWGGGLAFDENGYLYFSVGDAAESDKVQSLDSYLGKVLRLDVGTQDPYGIPADNPFALSSLPEVYALGFRNPWRISYDSDSRQLIVGDVGQARWEEINQVQPGGNYGWPIWEGERCTIASGCEEEQILPSHSYAHDAGSAAIIGGFIYRGKLLNDYYGQYFYGDAVSGNIYAVDLAAPAAERQLVANNDSVFSFAVGQDDELYVLGRNNIKKLVQVEPASRTDFPELLSETGCFVSSDTTIPEIGLFPYRVNAQLWSDGASKDRWFALPDWDRPGTQISEGVDGAFDFPVGSVLVKNFSFNETKIETRLLVRHEDGEWGGYSYQWFADQTDAVLLEDRKTVDFGNVVWTYPGRADCFQCHSKTVGGLGLESGQLNGPAMTPNDSYNQLSLLEDAGYLVRSGANIDALVNPHDDTLDLQDRAKSYLHSNCSGCHYPGGIAPGNFDFRYPTKLEDMGLLSGDNSRSEEQVLVPGDSESSVLLHRLRGDDGKRMPPLATTKLDYEAIDLFESWINSMDGAERVPPSTLIYPGANAVTNGSFTMKGAVPSDIDDIRVIVFDFNNNVFFGDAQSGAATEWFYTSPELEPSGDHQNWKLTVDLPEGSYRVNIHSLKRGERTDLTSVEFTVVPD